MAQDLQVTPGDMAATALSVLVIAFSCRVASRLHAKAAEQRHVDKAVASARANNTITLTCGSEIRVVAKKIPSGFPAACDVCQSCAEVEVNETTMLYLCPGCFVQVAARFVRRAYRAKRSRV